MLRRYLLPRHIFFAVLFTTILIGYAVSPQVPRGDAFLVVMLLAAASAVVWYENQRTQRGPLKSCMDSTDISEPIYDHFLLVREHGYPER